MAKTRETVDSVVVRFAGDSGDGMQVTGAQFTETTALAGNDLATFPDFPAEIRAPAGMLAGVSGFQIHFSRNEVFTPGDAPSVLVAMNPAALKVNLADVPKGGMLIINNATFDKKNLEKAGYKSNPLEDGSLSNHRVVSINITGQTLQAIEGLKLGKKEAERTKNFYALGIVYWLFDRELDHSETWIRKRFASKGEAILEANLRALRAGHAFGETTELFPLSYTVPKATIAPGLYRNLSGNEATALGFLTASELSGLRLFLASYPITPASDILHFLSMQKKLGTLTFQAEDEIAAIAAAIGGAYAGALALTTTSGPGFSLKMEGLGLAVMMELPLVVVDVQRGGPSTGLPTKTEQADLMQALHGRHGEAPLPIIAAATSGDCFYSAIEAARIAIQFMTPVVLLTDGFIANSSEPWKIPDLASIPKINVPDAPAQEGFQPYSRNDVLARPWAIPGMPGLEHRLGGLEKQHLTGNVSGDGPNHEFMMHLRADKIRKVADTYEPLEVAGATEGQLLLVSWGSTFGAVRAAVESHHRAGKSVGHVHLRHMNPLPKDLEGILKKYKRVLCPELNLGQLSTLLRAKYLVNVESMPKVQGKPFRETEISEAIARILEAN